MLLAFLQHLAVDGTLEPSPLPNSGKGDVAQQYLPELLKVVFAVLGAVALLIIVIAGMQYMLAAGDPGKMAQSKKAVLYALIGLVVALSAYGIVSFVVKGIS